MDEEKEAKTSKDCIKRQIEKEGSTGVEESAAREDAMRKGWPKILNNPQNHEHEGRKQAS